MYVDAYFRGCSLGIVECALGVVPSIHNVHIA